MMNKKITILVLALAVMAVVSGCWKKEINQPVTGDNKQIVNQEQNSKQKVEDQKIEKIASSTEYINISDWQIYKNQEYSFEFKYPKDWYWEDYTEEFNMGKPIIGFYPNNQKKDWEYYGDIELEILENKEKIDVEKFFKITYSDMPFCLMKL